MGFIVVAFCVFDMKRCTSLITALLISHLCSVLSVVELKLLIHPRHPHLAEDDNVRHFRKASPEKTWLLWQSGGGAPDESQRS